MTNFVLVVELVAEPDLRPPTQQEIAHALEHVIGRTPEDYWFQTVQDYTRAAGCYVEIEGTGQICTFAPGILTIDDGTSVAPWPDQFGGPETLQHLHVELPRSGRPLVLLAVGGGNQEFDHWDEEGSICVGQGGRCETAEPPADAPYALFAKAVFKKKPEDARMAPVGDAHRKFGRQTIDPGRG